MGILVSALTGVEEQTDAGSLSWGDAPRSGSQRPMGLSGLEE
jgi:hypothetical protein